LVELKIQGIIDEIYCFCSKEEVIPYLIDGVTFLKRPEILDQKETKGTQIYETFVDMVNADVYVLAHATSPFVTTEHIGDCVKKVQSGEYDSAFCAKKIQNFLWEDNKPLNFELSNPLRTQDMKPIYMELSTPYVFTHDSFKKYHSRSGVKPYICEASEIEAIDIDYPEDFQLADVVYTNIIKRKD
jgi:CMP-N-acetylneuraminic acid synthetase